MRIFREKPLTELVKTRRATDSFISQPIAKEDLEQILKAGLEAPSSYNHQPWRFVVVRDQEQRRKLRIAAMNQRKVEDAPVVIVACGDTLGWREDLEEIIRIGREHDIGGDAWADRKRRNVIADLGSHPNISMWVTKQTMIAATTLMWMAEALGMTRDRWKDSMKIRCARHWGFRNMFVCSSSWHWVVSGERMASIPVDFLDLAPFLQSDMVTRSPS